MQINTNFLEYESFIRGKLALIWTPSVWSEQNGKNTVNSVSLLIPIFGTKVKSKGRGKERAKGKVSRLLTNEKVRFVHSTANQKILCLLVFLISHGGIVHTTINPIFTCFQVFWWIKFDNLTCLVSTCLTYQKFPFFYTDMHLKRRRMFVKNKHVDTFLYPAQEFYHNHQLCLFYEQQPGWYNL